MTYLPTFQVCHVVLGLKPRTRLEEADIVLGWLCRQESLGYRVGVVANSDGHKGRPGASYPGAATFGAYGGLTCFTVPELTRDAVFQAIRDRATVATTGCRVALDVTVHTAEGTLPMGAIAATAGTSATRSSRNGHT